MILRKFKITGYPSMLRFSADGNYIMVGTYEGGVQIFNLQQDKVLFKVRLKGPKHDLPIHYCAISFDNRYFAFSCLFKIFVIDLQQKEIVKEFDYAKDLELQASVSFSFFNRQNSLVYPNGKKLVIYNFETAESVDIALSEQAGLTNELAINQTDDLIAYKSWNDSLKDSLSIIDLKTMSSTALALPYKKSHHQLFMCKLQFTDDDTLVVFRKGLGFSYFDLRSKIEKHHITWEDLGFRSVHNYLHTQVSGDGRYLLIHREKPDKEDLDAWYVDVPDGMDYVIFDTNTNRIIYTLPKYESVATFDMKHRLFAFMESEEESKNKFLTIKTI